MRYRHYAWMGILLVGISCAWAQISEQRLFTIPYGTGKDQLAVPPLREEIESVPTQAPIAMRRLQTGDFVIIAYRRDEGVVVQVFSAEGRLKSYAQLRGVGPDEPLAVYEGNIYFFSYAVPKDLDREELMLAFRTDGKAIPLDETRRQLATVLKEINFDGYGEPKTCGEVLYIPVYCRVGGETHRKVITLTKSGDIEVGESELPLFGYPVCLPGCELGIVEFSGNPSYVDSEIVLRRKSGAKIMQTSLKEDDLDLDGLEFLHLLRSWSLVAKQESLILFISAKYKSESATLGFPVNVTVMVLLDSQGRAMKLRQFDMPVGSHNVWDSDSEGNVYYLAFTKEGAEMRKLTMLLSRRTSQGEGTKKYTRWDADGVAGV